MPSPIDLRAYIPSAVDGPFAALLDSTPWQITANADAIIRRAIGGLSGYAVQDGVAIHRTADVEPEAVIKAPAVIGPKCFVAASAYLRGGVFLDEECVVGPACEIKSVFALIGAKIAHLSFVGDSIIGAGVNIEAGAVVANFRNENEDKRIRISVEGRDIDTSVERFGALIGDGARIGANAVIAPGAVVRPGAVIPRLALIDQSPPGDRP